MTNPKQEIVQKIGSIQYSFLAGSFFQNNYFILPLLIDFIVSQIQETKTKYLIDAYCGCGFFALQLAHHFEKVFGVDVSEPSIQYAIKNAKNNQIENSHFFLGKAETIFDDLSLPGKDSIMVIDPPRKGCDILFLNQLFKLNPHRVIYVSCNPSTQMRDLKVFLENDYQLEKVQPFDFFPQTKHLECVVVLQQRN